MKEKSSSVQVPDVIPTNISSVVGKDTLPIPEVHKMLYFCGIQVNNSM